MRFRGGEGERPHSTNCLGSPPLSPSITNNIHLGYVYIASCPRHDPSHPVHELTHYVLCCVVPGTAVSVAPSLRRYRSEVRAARMPGYLEAVYSWVCRVCCICPLCVSSNRRDPSKSTAVHARRMSQTKWNVGGLSLIHI